MSNVNVSIMVRLVDLVTAPLRRLQGMFDKFAGLARKIGVLGSAIAAISFMQPIQQAAAFEQKLRDIAVTAGQFGQKAEDHITGMKGKLFDLALQSGLSADALQEAFGNLVASGMDDAAANRLLPTLARVAKATSALPLDVSKVAYALNTTLGIASDQMEGQLARLVVAGKLGRFEFKDMAKVIPEISSSLKDLGVTGAEAVATMGASLQVAMFGTDSTSTAANNFKNFLSKLLSPEARKNFKDMGVDIAAVMIDATNRGLNPFEAALHKIGKLTGVSQKQIDAMMKNAKGKGLNDKQAAEEVAQNIKAILGRTKLGQLFGDQQVQDFLIPALMNMEKYKVFKEAIKTAGIDVIANDFQTQMAGLGTQLTIFNQIIDIFEDRIGMAFSSNLGWINAGLIELLGQIKAVDAAFPGLIDKVLTFGGGALVLVTALGLLGPVFSVLSAGIGVVAAVIGAILSPIGLLVAAFVGAAAIIYSDWENFAPFFSQMWGGLKQEFSGAVRFVKALFSGDWAGAKAAAAQFLAGLGQIGSGLLSVLGRLGSIIGNWAMSQLPAPWRQAAELALAALAAVFSRLGSILRGVGIALGAAATAVGERMAKAADWVREKWQALLSWLGLDGPSVFSRLGGLEHNQGQGGGGVGSPQGHDRRARQMDG